MPTAMKHFSWSQLNYLVAAPRWLILSYSTFCAPPVPEWSLYVLGNSIQHRHLCKNGMLVCQHVVLDMIFVKHALSRTPPCQWINLSVLDTSHLSNMHRMWGTPFAVLQLKRKKVFFWLWHCLDPSNLNTGQESEPTRQHLLLAKHSFHKNKKKLTYKYCWDSYYFFRPITIGLFFCYFNFLRISYLVFFLCVKIARWNDIPWYYSCESLSYENWKA